MYLCDHGAAETCRFSTGLVFLHQQSQLQTSFVRRIGLTDLALAKDEEEQPDGSRLFTGQIFDETTKTKYLFSYLI
jgi:hypothetical protein